MSYMRHGPYRKKTVKKPFLVGAIRAYLVTPVVESTDRLNRDLSARGRFREDALATDESARVNGTISADGRSRR